MGTQGFEDKVLRSAPGELPSKALEEAIYRYARQGLTQDRNVRGCILLAYRVQCLIASAVSSRDVSTPRQRPLTPGSLVVSNGLAAAIKPAVEAVRKTIFGSTRPPFACYEAAVSWLEQMAKEPLAPSRPWKENALRSSRERFWRRWSNWTA